MKSPVPVIEPDLNARLGEALLDDNVRCTILVHVDGRGSYRGLIGFEGEQAYSPPRIANTHTEYILTTVLPETHQGYAVWLLVVIEIRNDESLAEMVNGEVATISLR
jgi:hypothetical protein